MKNSAISKVLTFFNNLWKYEGIFLSGTSFGRGAILKITHHIQTIEIFGQDQGGKMGIHSVSWKLGKWAISYFTVIRHSHDMSKQQGYPLCHLY